LSIGRIPRPHRPGLSYAGWFGLRGRSPLPKSWPSCAVPVIAVRNHNGMAFSFSPESRSPSTGFPGGRTSDGLT
jgi:hypothetical protein